MLNELYQSLDPIAFSIGPLRHAGMAWPTLQGFCAL